MSTSSLHESTDSIDGEHNTVRAAADNIVYTVFNLLTSFSLILVDFPQVHEDICYCVSGLL